MAKNNNLTDFLKGIADKLRSVLGTSELIDPQDFETKIDTVYQKGKQDSNSDFWDDVFTPNGTPRTKYDYLFANSFWNDALWETIPKSYTMKPVSYWGKGFQSVFTNSVLKNPFKTSLNPTGKITLNTAEVTNCNYAFSGSSIEHLPTIDASCDTGGLYYMCYGAKKLISIDKLVLRATGSNTFVQTLTDCVALTNIVIEGSIGQDGFNVSSCTKLTHDSLLSIINALKDYSGTTTAKTVTLGATNLAKLTDAEKATATEKGWTLA